MTLDELRKEIDDIDERIINLLNERASIALGAGKIKRHEGLSEKDPARENDIFARVKELNKGPLTDEKVNTIYKTIISACLDVQT